MKEWFADEKETAGRKDWWMKKKQQEGKVGL